MADALPVDLRRAYRLDPAVGLRPEADGALAYHYGTRRLHLVSDRALADTLRSLDEHPCAGAALDSAGVARPDRPAYALALGRLAASGVIRARD